MRAVVSILVALLGASPGPLVAAVVGVSAAARQAPAPSLVPGVGAVPWRSGWAAWPAAATSHVVAGSSLVLGGDGQGDHDRLSDQHPRDPAVSQPSSQEAGGDVERGRGLGDGEQVIVAEGFEVVAGE